jgi:pimeloyl-ACP methyl ester carboxylesterase
MQPQTRYAKSGDVHIAYQVFGEGPDLVVAPGFVSHIENYWGEPRFARWLNKLGGFCRVILFDKRGTGLSDRVGNLPHMDERMDDLRAVMDAVNIERASVLGFSEGGSLAALFAASHPKRCRSLILFGAFTRSGQIPSLATDEAFGRLIKYIDTAWGSGRGLATFVPSKANDDSLRQWWGKFERLGASPSAAIALMRMNREIDISGILHSIKVPTLVIHLTDDALVSVEGGRELAAGIPGARLVEIPGTDHLIFLDAGDRILEEIQEFLTGTRSAPGVDRVLATVVFEDIVDSTRRAEANGDRAWRNLLDDHDKAVRQELSRFRGREVKSLGDGFLATFDGPARAIHCASSIRDQLHRLDLPVRIGVHTGEVELAENDVRGIAVHIASRVAHLGRADDVLVSRTVKDLVAGSGIKFEDFGMHSLKGIPEAWQVFRAVG